MSCHLAVDTECPVAWQSSPTPLDLSRFVCTFHKLCSKVTAFHIEITKPNLGAMNIVFHNYNIQIVNTRTVIRHHWNLCFCERVFMKMLLTLLKFSTTIPCTIVINTAAMCSMHINSLHNYRNPRNYVILSIQ